jgi:hypothetical protein
MPLAHGEPVVILHRTYTGEKDQYGNAQYTVEEIQTAAAVGPKPPSEDMQDRDQITAGLFVWLPPGTVVLATDQMRLRGFLYEVDGDSMAWQSPFTGLVAPLQVSLRRVTG